MAEDSIYRTMIADMGGIASFCRGVSMLPLIRQGKSYVSVVKVDDPKVGDILLFEQMRRGEKKNILHRLIEIRPDGTYVTRGDNCLGCEYLSRADIIGRADRIFWLRRKHKPLMATLLGAEPDTENAGYRISVDAPGYLRYVRLWNASWPLRRVYYRLRARASIRARLARISWLRRLYHSVFS